MKYETPELTALTSAINAIQESGPGKVIPDDPDGSSDKEALGAYADWEK